MKIENMTSNEAIKKIYEIIPHAKWRNIFLQNVLTEKGTL